VQSRIEQTGKENQMGLGEFVNKSIKQLIDDIIDAQKYAAEKELELVNPLIYIMTGRT
jgi:hypothetical protein